jgi:glucose-1-phosphate thymidylyltransferase
VEISSKKNPGMERVGLVPAAGRAARMAPLPCSKEVFPIGFRPVDEGRGFRPKAACHYLLESLQSAGVTKAYMVIRKGKWDIPAYLGDGEGLNLNLAYLMMGLPFGVPYTLDQAYPFVRDAVVVFGFPDIVFQPEHAFTPLLEKQNESHADVVLGLFPAHQPSQADMVDLDTAGRVRGIRIKPSRTDLRYTWIIAVWTPVFTRFMHNHVLAHKGAAGDRKPDMHRPDKEELHVGHVIQAALDNRLHIDSVLFASGRYVDIGIPEDMVKAVQWAPMPENNTPPQG